MRNLYEEFRHFRGQPVEVIMDNGIKFCGIAVDSNAHCASLVDREGRLVRMEFCHICAMVEPQMQLNRFCGTNSCGCSNEYDQGQGNG